MTDITISGTVENVVYRNRENDYAVIDLAVNESELVTAVGIMPAVAEGEETVLTGKWIMHPEFGKQFSAEKYEKKLPETLSAMLKYLSSGVIKGVGTATAVKIINKFGTDTFDVLENHPEWLADINGITYKKAAKISESFMEQKDIVDLMMFCKGCFSGNVVNKIYKKYGKFAIGNIRENPYILCRENIGISFDKADEIARELGFSSDSPIRTGGAILYYLNSKLWINGHTCYPVNEFKKMICNEISVPMQAVEDEIKHLAADFKVYIHKSDTTDYIYDFSVWEQEKYIADKLFLIDRTSAAFSEYDISVLLEKTQRELGIQYALMQKKALFSALDGGVLVITGGPGTGKTTIIKALLRIYSSVGLKTVLAAPTGRAANRMSEATSNEAKTVHRLLEMQRGKGDEPVYLRKEDNPIQADAIIVDESSMIDVSLMSALLSAIKRGSRLVLIGDCDQLPSVGPGNVFSDIIRSASFKTVILDKIFRQSSDSLIITNAHLINKGSMPNISSKNSDFFFLSRENESMIPSTVVSLLAERLPRSYGKEFTDGVQVITPSRIGAAGTQALNPLIQEALNPKSPNKNEIRLFGKIFREGDRIMQTRNNYDIEWIKNYVDGNGIFNGEIGKIAKIDTAKEKVTVVFDDRIAEYDYQMFEDVDLAYAITVHKSQGSEYPCIIIPLYSMPLMLLNRKMIYTAVTRGKGMVILVGRSDILAEMIENNKINIRHSSLLELLTDEK